MGGEGGEGAGPQEAQATEAHGKRGQEEGASLRLKGNLAEMLGQGTQNLEGYRKEWAQETETEGMVCSGSFRWM